MYLQPPATGWGPGSYIELAVSDVLTAEGTTVTTTMAHAALLLAGTGFVDESDRLIDAWQAGTGLTVDDLLGQAVTRRALTMMLDARSDIPAWAQALRPADRDAQEAAHRAYLDRRQSRTGEGELENLLGPAAAEALTEAATDLGGPRAHTEPVDPLRQVALAAEQAAQAGDHRGARAELHRWARKVRGIARPPVAMLCGCRHLAPLLLSGVLADPLGVDQGWARRCAGDVLAAFARRYPSARRDRAGKGAGESGDEGSLRGLIDAVLSARDHPELPAATPSRGASPAQLYAAALRIGMELPADYLEFLAIADGLPGDVVFPRLLGADELAASSEPGLVVISAPGQAGTVIVLLQLGQAVETDPVLGSTVHPSFRGLLQSHLELLRRC